MYEAHSFSVFVARWMCSWCFPIRRLGEPTRYEPVGLGPAVGVVYIVNENLVVEECVLVGTPARPNRRMMVSR